MKHFKLVEVKAIPYLLKKDSPYVWDCGCTRYTPGMCECGNQAWLVHMDGTPVGGVDVAVKLPFSSSRTSVGGVNGPERPDAEGAD